MEFFYDASGLAGLKYDGAIYFYRKDAQGNIIEIFGINGIVVATYTYDAWGNHIIRGKKERLAYANPFRYRGYYYDSITKLYFLQSRYYDPEVGRFISQDSVEYADPEAINGLNLYAYCGNNPVMNVDPTGYGFITFLWILTGILLAGVLSGVGAVSNASEDENKWGAFLGGFVNGVISAVGVAAGVATGGVFGGIIAIGTGFIGGFAGDVISQSISYGDVDLIQSTYTGVVNGLINVATYIGFRNSGIFNDPSWAKRFVSVISPSSITTAISIYLMTLTLPNYKRKMPKINDKG